MPIVNKCSFFCKIISSERFYSQMYLLFHRIYMRAGIMFRPICFVFLPTFHSRDLLAKKISGVSLHLLLPDLK